MGNAEIEDLTKKDKLLLLFAVILPFVMITLDHLIVPNELVTQKYLFAFLGDYPFLSIFILFLYEMFPSFICIGFINAPSGTKAFLAGIFIIGVFPLVFLTHLAVGLDIYYAFL